MKNEGIVEGFVIEKVVQIGRFTLTEIKKDKIKAVGISRLSIGDRYNAERAKAVSLGRAKKALIKKVEGKIVHAILEG